ncbi:hypothetical protein ELQ92_03160 [Labedella populi]|uniref:Uncharacterized protein n=1 Tax=Labedella populi TaxID=2498850 RepID=A0A444QF94_9MICO|nr:hypothetical protein [Labedella populi]RWZ68241.1 hypothetical protein ELQ92_03160 [Labedella populi]
MTGEQNDRSADPTRVRNQPALRGTGRALWLTLGGILAAITITMLTFELPLQFGIALSGIIAVAVLYLLMVVSAVTMPPTRRRSHTLAWLMGAIAVAGIAALMIVLTVESS